MRSRSYPRGTIHASLMIPLTVDQLPANLEQEIFALRNTSWSVSTTLLIDLTVGLSLRYQKWLTSIGDSMGYKSTEPRGTEAKTFRSYKMCNPGVEDLNCAQSPTEIQWFTLTIIVLIATYATKLSRTRVVPLSSVQSVLHAVSSAPVDYTSPRHLCREK